MFLKHCKNCEHTLKEFKKYCPNCSSLLQPDIFKIEDKEIVYKKNNYSWGGSCWGKQHFYTDL